MLIRAAEVGDAAGLRDLYNMPGVQANTLQLPHTSHSVWHDRLAKPDPNRYMLVAVREDRVVGSCGLTVSPNPRRRHCADMFVGVADDCVGTGVGKALTAEVLRLADHWLQVTRVALTVYADNEPAIGLYRKFGFVEEGRLRAYAMRAGQLIDALAMARLRGDSI